MGEKETDEMRENGGLKTKVYQNREISQKVTGRRCLVSGGEEQNQQHVGEKETDQMRENGGLKTKVYQNREISQKSEGIGKNVTNERDN